jgi:predicted MFS family arabinose efflux permease
MKNGLREFHFPFLPHLRAHRRDDIAETTTARKLYLLSALYLSQAIPMGFIMGSLPVIMRSSGMSLKSIGFLFMLHLPWALKFFYASYVDRWYLPRLGRRRSWILPLQWLVVALFLGLSQTPPTENFVCMFGLFFAAALAMSTSDIAVDGYATDMLTPKERPWGNTIQAGSRSAGMVIGGGIPLLLYGQFQWQTICLALSVVLLFLNLPIVLHREIALRGQDSISKGAPQKGMLKLLKEPQTRRILAFLILPTAFFFLSFQMRMPLLNDLGLNTGQMGQALIWCGSPAGIAGSFLGGFLFQRLGGMRLLGWATLTALMLSFFTITLTGQSNISQWCGLIILFADNLLLGIVHVWSFTLMMKASAGPQAGTSFALYSSVFLLPPLIFAPLFGSFGDAYGFGFLYSLLTALIILGFGLASLMARRSLRGFLN